LISADISAAMRWLFSFIIALFALFYASPHWYNSWYFHFHWGQIDRYFIRFCRENITSLTSFLYFQRGCKSACRNDIWGSRRVFSEISADAEASCSYFLFKDFLASVLYSVVYCHYWVFAFSSQFSWPGASIGKGDEAWPLQRTEWDSCSGAMRLTAAAEVIS